MNENIVEVLILFFTNIVGIKAFNSFIDLKDQTIIHIQY